MIGSSAYSQDTFLDNFNTVSYSNNNGTMDFAEDWQDSDDNDPTGGRFYIRTATNRLRIQNMDY
ncbi:MAG: hypothetical protein HKP08_04000, partial [Flavobacteriaceae bacterium]|nr:hypothetical protein [Flavobacteriaceae bacterium]